MKKAKKNKRLEKSETCPVAAARAVTNGGQRERPVSNPIEMGKIAGRWSVNDSIRPLKPRAAQMASLRELNP